MTGKPVIGICLSDIFCAPLFEQSLCFLFALTPAFKDLIAVLAYVRRKLRLAVLLAYIGEICKVGAMLV